MSILSLSNPLIPFTPDSYLKPFLGLAAGAEAAAGISGLFSAGSGLLGGLFSSNEGAKQRKFAAEQNQLNRDFQHNEAELAYQRNEQTRLAQNDWNSEQAQVSRLRQAGINPYNALGGLSGSSVSSASNTASAGNASGSQMMAQQANLSWINGLANAGLMAAQARNLDAQTKNLNSETSGQDLQNKYQEMYNDIFKDYGRVEKLVQINELDARRGAEDASAAFQRIQERVGEFDLNTMKPQEYKNKVAEETATYMRSELDRILAIKSETDRQIELKKLSWELSLMSAQYTYYMAAAFNQRSQGNLANAGIPVQGALAGMYSKQGALFDSQSNLNTWSARNSMLGYYNRLNMRNQIGDSFLKAVKADLNKTTTFNGQFSADWLTQKTAYILHNLGSFIPGGSSPYNVSPNYSINPYQ